MPKAYCYLTQKIVDQLEAIKQDEGHESLSGTMKEMLELGIKVYLQNKDNPELDADEKRRLEKEAELAKQHTAYLLKLLAINADIFRCVYDKSKVTDGANSAEDHLAQMKNKVEDFIETYKNS